MKNPEKYIGKKYNHLTIISIINTENSVYSTIKVVARCDCGVEVIKKLYYIEHDVSKSCGCFRHIKYSPDVSPMTFLFHSYRKKAKTCSQTFELNKDVFCKLIVQPCFYCGEKQSNTLKSRIENNGRRRF